MTICLCHDCILTKRVKRGRAQGGRRTPARTRQPTRVKVECVGRANIHVGYVSLFKQSSILRHLFTITRIAVAFPRKSC